MVPVLAAGLLLCTAAGAQMVQPLAGNSSAPVPPELVPDTMAVPAPAVPADPTGPPLTGSTESPPSPAAVDGVLSLSGYLSILQQFRTAGLLPTAADGLGLTLCGAFPPEWEPTPPELWDVPWTLRTCQDCQRQFRAELLREKPAMPRVLLLGAGCGHWPGAQPLTNWSPRPAVLLGRLDCRLALLRPELDRLPDLLCLQLNGRSGRLFRRTFALRSVREVGSWSEVNGLRITDWNTGVQPNGHIVTDGTPLRVAFMQFTSKRYQCKRSPHNNRTCSNVDVRTRMPLFRFIQLKLKLHFMEEQYNTTLEFIDTTHMKPMKTRIRLPRPTLRAVGLLAAGGADHAWPNSAAQTAFYHLPVSMVDNRYLVPFVFITVRRPSRLDATRMLQLLSPGAWGAVCGSTLLVAALLALMRRNRPVSAGFSDALALLLGQGVLLSSRHLLPRHRPLVAIWAAMSLTLTTAFLSDLIKALTVPEDNSPRTASDLLKNDYHLFADFNHIRSLYRVSPKPSLRVLGRTMKLIPSQEERARVMLQESWAAYTMALPTVWEATVDMMLRSNGSMLLEDLNFGQEIFRYMLFGSFWSKNHPLVRSRFTFASHRMASGLTSNTRFVEQSRYFGLLAKTRACARRQPSCYTEGIVRSLTLANLRGPLVIWGVGAALGLLALLVELAVAQLSARRRRDRVDPDTVHPVGPVE